MPTFEVDYQTGINQYLRSVQQGDEELEALGFPVAQRPRDTKGMPTERPDIPTNLSALSMGQLTDLLGYATGWYRYALEVLPTVASERDTAESARDFSWAKIRKSRTEKLVADKDNATRCDVRYIEAAARFETCSYKYRRIKAICDGLLREVETISRAMSGLEQTQRAEGTVIGGARRAYRQGQAPSGELPFRKKNRVVEDE